MKRRTRMDVMADLLADPSMQPEDVTILMAAYQEVTELVRRSVAFHLTAANKDRPDATKYGTHTDGSPRYAPEWYMAQGIETAILDGLYGTLAGVLSCEEVDEHGHRCIGSLLHDSCCWDGNGCNWWKAAA